MPAHRTKKTFCVVLPCVLTAVYLMQPLMGRAESLVTIAAAIASPQELDELRGGFTAGNGLELSFGIEQTVLIDGVLQMATVFNASTITGMVARQTAPPPPVATNIDQLRSQLTTVIQNRSDQRIIDNITVINASVNSLTLSRQIHAMQAIQRLNIAAGL